MLAFGNIGFCGAFSPASLFSSSTLDVLVPSSLVLLLLFSISLLFPFFAMFEDQVMYSRPPRLVEDRNAKVGHSYSKTRRHDSTMVPLPAKFVDSSIVYSWSPLCFRRTGSRVVSTSATSNASALLLQGWPLALQDLKTQHRLLFRSGQGCRQLYRLLTESVVLSPHWCPGRVDIGGLGDLKIHRCSCFKPEDRPTDGHAHFKTRQALSAAPSSTNGVYGVFGAPVPRLCRRRWT